MGQKNCFLFLTRKSLRRLEVDIVQNKRIRMKFIYDFSKNILKNKPMHDLIDYANDEAVSLRIYFTNGDYSCTNPIITVNYLDTKYLGSIGESLPNYLEQYKKLGRLYLEPLPPCIFKDYEYPYSIKRIFLNQNVPQFISHITTEFYYYSEKQQESENRKLDMFLSCSSCVARLQNKCGGIYRLKIGGYYKGFEFYDRITKMIHQKGGNLMEVGCGDIPLIDPYLELAAKDSRIICVDPSLDFFMKNNMYLSKKVLSRQQNILLLSSTLKQSEKCLETMYGKVSLILLIFSLGHLCDVPVAFKLMNKLLRTRGTVYILEVNHESNLFVESVKEHSNKMGVKGLLGLFQENGFGIQRKNLTTELIEFELVKI